MGKYSDNAQQHTAEEERAGHVLFVITTEVMENASLELNYKRVCQMIEQQKCKNGGSSSFSGQTLLLLLR